MVKSNIKTTIETKGGSAPTISSGEDFRSLYASSLKQIKEGGLVKGRIVEVRRDEVLVDIGYKSEGVIPLAEFVDRSEIEVGNSIDVLLESLEDQNGMVVLSKQKAERLQNWERTINNCAEGKVIKGKVFRKVKGGLMVDIGMEAFLPASQIDVKHVKNIDEFLGKVYEFKIIKINAERKNVVLSRRQLLEETRKRDKDKLLSEIKIGDTRVGRVKNLTDFGAFIDLNGGDGLLHITDMSWGRINHPSEILKIGDEIEVVVLDLDREKERISLGLKQRTPNPWSKIEEKFPVGSRVRGKIVNLMPYGVFVELESGIQGLIHISELSWTRRCGHPSELFKLGDEVEAQVLSIDQKNEKISLGVKQLETPPWDNVDERYPVGKRVQGKVRNLTNYGLFVELEEGIDGLIHISDLSWSKKITNPADHYKKGDVVEAIVLSVDQDNKKISLGVKQLTHNPWERINELYHVGNVVKGRVSKVAGFGVFVELQDGIEGLVHNSQLQDSATETPSKPLKEGDEVTAKVVRIDPTEKKIALSIKEYLLDQKNPNRATPEDIKEVLNRERQIPSDFADKITHAIEKGKKK